MNADDDHDNPDAPMARPVDSYNSPPTDYMAGQVGVMRMENPEVWTRIDALTDGEFDATAYRHLLVTPKSECEACGYNLFGNTSGLCPECGTPVHGSAEARRLLSIRIFDALRTAKPEKWADVSERLERQRMESVEREFSEEGARRDKTRRRALQSWLDRKRRESEQ